MEKKTFQFLLITAVFFVAYSLFLSRINPPVPAGKSDPLSQTMPKESSEMSPGVAMPFKETAVSPAAREEILQEIEVENFNVTYSLTGGYIKIISVKKYNEPLLYENIGYVENYKNEIFTLAQSGNKITLTSSARNVKKEFIFDGYHLTLNFYVPGKDDTMLLCSYPLSSDAMDQRYQEFLFKEDALPAGTIKRIPLKKVKENTYSSSLLGMRGRYFCAVLFGKEYQAIISKDEKNTLFLRLPLKSSSTFNLFIGPQLKAALEPYQLNDIVNYGFFHVIALVILKILYFYQSVLHNWGISIILMSLTAYLFLFPFTMKSTQSMKKMQNLQPQIEALREKLKDNPQKLNKEILELYRSKRVNPVGGCLPLFFQIPVLFAFYQALLRLAELKGASFLWIKDLSLPDRLYKLPPILPIIDKYMGGYVNILPLILIGISLVQQKYTMASSGSDQQKSMGLFFAVFIGVIFYNFSSALVIYWLVQNFLTLLYQYRISQKPAE